jgi:hypothetical protein
MGFYLRKSIKAGPLRFNLSKSGIGMSAGVKGLRVGTGPRGAYVHAGRGGIYYRQTLGAPRRPASGGRGKPNELPVAQDGAQGPATLSKRLKVSSTQPAATWYCASRRPRRSRNPVGSRIHSRTSSARRIGKPSARARFSTSSTETYTARTSGWSMPASRLALCAELGMTPVRRRSRATRETRATLVLQRQLIAPLCESQTKRYRSRGSISSRSRSWRHLEDSCSCRTSSSSTRESRSRPLTTAAFAGKRGRPTSLRRTSPPESYLSAGLGSL